MVSVISETASRIVAVHISGHPTPHELEAMGAELEEALRTEERDGLLLQLQRFCGIHAEALMAESLFKYVAVEVTTGRDLRRIALVGEAEWRRWTVAVLRPVVSATVRYFPPDELAQAHAWLGTPAGG